MQNNNVEKQIERAKKVKKFPAKNLSSTSALKSRRRRPCLRASKIPLGIVAKYKAKQRKLSKKRIPVNNDNADDDDEVSGSASVSESESESTTIMKTKAPIPLPILEEDINTPQQAMVEALIRIDLSAIPEELPRNENELKQIYEFVSEKLIARQGGIMYLSGEADCGKMETVKKVQEKLSALLLKNDDDHHDHKKLPLFKYIETNGKDLENSWPFFPQFLMEPSPNGIEKHQCQAGRILLEALIDKSGTNQSAVLIIDQYDPHEHNCTEDVIQHLVIDWSHFIKSKLVVLAVINRRITSDVADIADNQDDGPMMMFDDIMPAFVTTNTAAVAVHQTSWATTPTTTPTPTPTIIKKEEEDDESSCVPLVPYDERIIRVVFPPNDQWIQLMKIIESKLEHLNGHIVFESDTLPSVCRTVVSMSGNVHTLFNICRCALQMAIVDQSDMVNMDHIGETFKQLFEQHFSQITIR